MARPKVLPNQKNAYERLSDAFWTTLEVYPLEQISVTSISKMAKVNHNTFYYYFDNAEDMARKLLADTCPAPDAILKYIEESEGSVEADDPATLAECAKLHRTLLLIRSSHPSIHEDLREQGIRTWGQVSGVDPAELTSDDRNVVVFVIGGVLELIREQKLSEGMDLRTFLTQPAGIIARQMLNTVKDKYTKAR